MVIQSAVTKLTDIILGYNTDDLVDILKDIATEYGISNIAHLRLSANTSSDASLLSAVVTFSREWQTRYFLKQYFSVDPVIAEGCAAILPFDWQPLATKSPEIVEFFADAIRHNVGRNGLSIPLRNRINTRSLVSFTSDVDRPEWEMFTKLNMKRLQHLAALIDAAASVNTKPPTPQIQLSRREEQCLIWAARGKTYQEIADILSLSPTSVRSHLDGARRKLHSINLTQAVGVAVATGVLPAVALRNSP